ncbi:MAG: hypothetical protein VCD31_16375, partial [Alphaproteobacteria bacterium]
MTDETTLSHDLTAILSDLIAIPSAYPPGDTTEISAYIRARYERAGYSCQTLSRADGVDNVVARTGAGSPQLALNCHIDTVEAGERADWLSAPL